MKKNLNRLSFIASLAYLGYAGASIYRGIKQERENRHAYKSNTKDELDVIVSATHEMLNKIESGAYLDKSTQELMTDYEFIKIAHFNKE